MLLFGRGGKFAAQIIGDGKLTERMYSRSLWYRGRKRWGRDYVYFLFPG